MRSNFIAVLFVLALQMNTVPESAVAQPRSGGRPNVFGEINLQEDEAGKDPYKENQDSAIGFFKEMSQRVKALGQGRAAGQASLTDGALIYLTGVYLFCAAKSGTCPLVLDSILEADIVNARLSGQTEDCHQMKKFWTYWVKADMEQRLSYLVPLSYQNDMLQFNSKVRPGYIRCSDTVKETVSGPSADSFFKGRYAGQSREALLASKMASLLEGLKQKVPNVFIATGASKAPAADGGKAGSK